MQMANGFAQAISIHAPRTGSDRRCHIPRIRRDSISIHAPRTGSDQMLASTKLAKLISIHAPRTGSDRHGRGDAGRAAEFQSTLPARGATKNRNDTVDDRQQFQSTLPARGATQGRRCRARHPDISIHAPRTGSDTAQRANHCRFSISIHAPRTGSDSANTSPDTSADRFQSTLPARGATPRHNAIAASRSHFNPRSPHGERPPAKIQVSPKHLFQSTLPARGATTSALLHS